MPQRQEDPDILHMVERKLVSKILEGQPASPTHAAPPVGINLQEGRVTVASEGNATGRFDGHKCRRFIAYYGKLEIYLQIKQNSFLLNWRACISFGGDLWISWDTHLSTERGLDITCFVEICKVAKF